MLSIHRENQNLIPRPPFGNQVNKKELTATIRAQCLGPPPYGRPWPWPQQKQISHPYNGGQFLHDCIRVSLWQSFEVVFCTLVPSVMSVIFNKVIPLLTCVNYLPQFMVNYIFVLPKQLKIVIIKSVKIWVSTIVIFEINQRSLFIRNII